jgi:hypothetical protein
MFTADPCESSTARTGSPLRGTFVLNGSGTPVRRCFDAVFTAAGIRLVAVGARPPREKSPAVGPATSLLRRRRARTIGQEHQGATAAAPQWLFRRERSRVLFPSAPKS